MRKLSRRSMAASAAALTLGVGAAVAATTAASAAPAGPAVPPVCTTGNLSVWVSADAVNGAAGTWYYPLEFTNVSNHACRTFGYPGVSALSSSGRQLGDAAARNTLYHAAWVTIPAGGTAHSLFAYRAAEVNTSNCNPKTAAVLRVFPPNQTSAHHAFFDLPVCSASHHIYLTVTVLRPGTNI
jgi:hypothetical protein